MDKNKKTTLDIPEWFSGNHGKLLVLQIDTRNIYSLGFSATPSNESICHKRTPTRVQTYREGRMKNTGGEPLFTHWVCGEYMVGVRATLHPVLPGDVGYNTYRQINSTRLSLPNFRVHGVRMGNRSLKLWWGGPQVSEHLSIQGQVEIKGLYEWVGWEQADAKVFSGHQIKAMVCRAARKI